MGGIFINYRRGDTAGEARALFNELREKVGAEVFMDVDIPVGRDFRQVLAERLASVDVMLTLIGSDWISAKGNDGKSRLANPDDFVRREIRAALERNIAVAPVLLQGAQMPAEGDLPDDIRDLAYRNAFELSHTRWVSDVTELIHRLGLVPPGATPTPASAAPPADPSTSAVRAATPATVAQGPAVGPAGRKWWPLVVGLLMMIIGAGAYQYYESAAADRLQRQRAEARAAQLEREAETARAQAVAEAASRADAQARLDQQRAQEKERAEASAAAANRDLKAKADKAKADKALADKALAEKARAEKELAERNAIAASATRGRTPAGSDAATAKAPAPAPGSREQAMADMRAGKFVGSISIGLGLYGQWKGYGWSTLAGAAGTAPCTVWSRQVPENERPAFLSACRAAPALAIEKGVALGARVSQDDWSAFCSAQAIAQGAPGTAGAAIRGPCLRYR